MFAVSEARPKAFFAPLTKPPERLTLVFPFLNDYFVFAGKVAPCREPRRPRTAPVPAPSAGARAHCWRQDVQSVTGARHSVNCLCINAAL